MSRFATIVATAALAALLAVDSQATTPPPVGPAHVLNTALPCHQDGPDLTALAGGGFVATWTGRLEAGHPGVGARLLDASGAPISASEIELTDEPPAGTRQARTAPTPEGGFAVAWIEPRGAPGFELPIGLQTFGADGAPSAATVLVAELPQTVPELRIDLATDGSGRPAVAWSQGDSIRFRLFEADLTPRTGIRFVATVPGPGEPPGIAGEVSIAADEDGELLVVWEESIPVPGPPPPGFIFAARARRFDAEGDALGPVFTIHEGGPTTPLMQAPTAAALAGGGWAVAWAETSPTRTGVYARLLDASGAPVGPAFQASASMDLASATEPDLEPLPDGGFVLVWSAVFDPGPIGTPPPSSPVVLIRRFGPGGIPVDDDVLVSAPDGGRPQVTPAVALGIHDLLAVVWGEHRPPGPVPTVPPCFHSATINARALLPGCAETDRRLCLQGGRFAVEVEVDDPRLGPPFPGLANAEPMTDDTGTFWFFRPDNLELMVKVLDGRGVNDHFWVFSGALSNVGYEVVVTDTLTGTERRYENRPGELMSRADTRAFLDQPIPPPLSAGSLDRTSAAAPLLLEPAGPAITTGGTPQPHAGATHPQLPCTDPHVLCLFDERFAAWIDWRDPRTGTEGRAFAEPLSEKSGTFWFFRPDNRELIFKMLDGRDLTGYFWIFFGALTDLEYTITVEDRVSHTSWSYDNPAFSLTSHADVHALTDFPCPNCSVGGAMTRSAEGDPMP